MVTAVGHGPGDSLLRETSHPIVKQHPFGIATANGATANGAAANGAAHGLSEYPLPELVGTASTTLLQ